MAKDRMTALEALRKVQEVEPGFVREVVRRAVQELMEAAASAYRPQHTSCPSAARTAQVWRPPAPIARTGPRSAGGAA